jgi:probable HAF family extracellular repeat protein
MILWHNGIPHKLATLGGSAFNTPEMINDENTVVGFSDLPGDKGGNNFNGHAFRWTQSIGTVDLGTLSGDTISFAYSVNDSGQIVGQSCNTNQCSVSRAFLYQNGTMYDLNGLLDSASAGFNLIFANDINDEGQITGLAVDPSGAIVGFRLNPDGTTPARSGEAVTMRSGKALNYHVHMGLFGRPIVTR